MGELKPCPFCGCELEPSDEDDGQYPFHPMDPASCPVNGQYVEHKSWNRRPAEAKLRAQLEAVREWLKLYRGDGEPYRFSELFAILADTGKEGE